MNMTVVEGDLLDQDVDVIVNAWNRNIIPWWLLLPQGVSGAIKKRGGIRPFQELGKHGSIPLGGAVLTSAGRLPFQAIIHVAVSPQRVLSSGNTHCTQQIPSIFGSALDSQSHNRLSVFHADDRNRQAVGSWQQIIGQADGVGNVMDLSGRQVGRFFEKLFRE